MDLSKIRNFCIISHIDHGKSTLADRFLELTGTVPQEKLGPQFLDSMALEKEKGITIKMHPVRMVYKSAAGSEFILNLIDTPGHIDFSYETSRALACVEGALILVDASKGIQAQTLFNLEEAQRQNLRIIGVVNKIDLPQARIEETRRELSSILKVDEKEVFLISAKTGQNVKALLEAVVEKIPFPGQRDDIFPRKEERFFSGRDSFRALIFDSKYDPFSGVVAFIRVFQGRVKKQDRIYLMAQKIESEVKEVGFFSPELKPAEELGVGEIGYIKTGIKEPGKVKVGDTIIGSQIEGMTPLPGYREPSPVLFLSIFPENADRFSELKQALEKLKLSDPSLTFEQTAAAWEISQGGGLGRGLRVGFLGSLQAEIIIRRLKEEFGIEIISSAPQVVFKARTQEGKEIKISSASDWPDPSAGGVIKEIEEPWAQVEIICPNVYLGQVFKILKNYSAVLKDTRNLTEEKSIFIVEAPLREVITGKFYEEIKSKTEGYSSFSFHQIGYRQADVVKLDILIAGRKEESFSKIVPREKAYAEGKTFLEKIKTILPAQQFALVLQAAVGGKILARETIKARRKDVTAPLYGGDVTRKRKLLEIQKRGKEEMKKKARIKIPPEVYLEMLKF